MSTSVIGLVSGRERDEIEYGDGHYGEKKGERDMDIAQERGRRLDVIKSRTVYAHACLLSSKTTIICRRVLPP